MPTYRMTVRTAFPGGTGAGTNTWHVRTTNIPIPPAPSVTNLVKNFYTAINAQFGAAYKWSWDGVLSEVGTTNPALVPVMTPWAVQGSSGGGNDSGPAGVGLCVTWRSGTATRSGRGRTFLSPLPAGWFDGTGTITDANLTLVRNAANTLIGGSLGDGNGAVVVYSAKESIARDVQGYLVNDRVAYMSSRRK